MKKRIYKNLLALTLACTVALSTAPVSSFARDVAAVSESEATTEAAKEKATEAEKKTEASKEATTVTEAEKKTEASEKKTTEAEKTESSEEKTTEAEKTEASEEKTTAAEKTEEKKSSDTECVKPSKPVVDGTTTEEPKKDTDEATKPSTVTLHFNQSMPGHVLSVSKASSFNFGGYASDSKATVKASYVGTAWNGKGYSSSTPSYKAGTYTETLYVSDAAYSAKSISRTYTITRANTHIIINNPVDSTYDGSAFAVDATVYDDNNNEVTKANVTYIRVDGGKYTYLGSTAPVDAGAYIAIATYPGDATHRPSAAKSFFIIHPKTVTVSIDHKKKYVGEEDPELTYEASGVLDGDSLGLKLTREAGEDPGFYDIYPDTSSLNPNYKLAETPDGTDHFEIIKKDSGEDPVKPSTEPSTDPSTEPSTDSSTEPSTDPSTTEDTGDVTATTDNTTPVVPGGDSDGTTEPTPVEPTTKTTKKTTTTTQKKQNTKKATTKKNKKSKSSKTGDTSNPVLYMVVSVFALVMCAFIVLRRKSDR